MLSNDGLPYVGRFACDWHRLSTTDPHAAMAQCKPSPSGPAPGRPTHRLNISKLSARRASATRSAGTQRPWLTQRRALSTSPQRTPPRSGRLAVRSSQDCPEDLINSARVGFISGPPTVPAEESITFDDSARGSLRLRKAPLQRPAWRSIVDRTSIGARTALSWRRGAP